MEHVTNDVGVIKEIIDEQTARVSVLKRGECSTCPGKKHCNLFTKNDATVIEARYTEDMQIGDRVMVVLNPGKRVKASLIIFALPLVVLIGAYYLANILTGNETISIFSSIGSFFLIFFGIFLGTRNSKFLHEYKPSIVKIEKKETAPESQT